MGRPLRENMRGDWAPTFDTNGPELLPCPFCGGEARIITVAKESWVLCDKCKASAEAHTSKQFAIAAWNRRAK